MEFEGFQKLARLTRNCIITEKLDGTNAQICIGESGEFLIGSRTRWITPDADNHGFAAWAMANKEELLKLGPGRHFGEWWGRGVQRGYNMIEKRFSLFNVSRWGDDSVRPACCHVVPVLATGIFTTGIVDAALEELRASGSRAAPGYPYPEGVVVFHVAGNFLFKKTLEKDDEPKSLRAA